MPQDIPLEASETLAFTPPSLANLENPPVFRLRAITGRDQHFQKRIYRERGLQTHGEKEVRDEILIGLKALWSEEDFERHSPVIKAWWEAQDDFVLQAKDNPDLKWEYDPEIERAIKILIEDVIRSHYPLCRMIADNQEVGDLLFPVVVAIALLGWSNFDVKMVKDRGYLTVECAEDVAARLSSMCKANGIESDAAWMELAIAATGRLKLQEEEAKNSESPVPSETSQALSTETNASDKDGKSPESPESDQTAPLSGTLPAE